MRRRSLPGRTLVAMFVMLGLAAGAEAFGNDGHTILCEIAFQRLTPEARALLDSIQADLGNVQDPFRECDAACVAGHLDDGRNLSFVEGCIWPDESRRDTFKDTYEYHFINVSNVFTSFELARDCGQLDCALAGIQRFAQYVAGTPGGSRERERRVLAVRFLGHFVGDLHQPLHVGSTQDLGGNLLFVRWQATSGGPRRNTNLHSVWDTDIIRRAGWTADPISSAHTLAAQITTEEAASWSTIDLPGWAAESFAAAQATAYRKPDGTPVQLNETLDDDYFAAARPVIETQLKKGGVRLAAILNAIAAGALPAQLLRLTAP